MSREEKRRACELHDLIGSENTGSKSINLEKRSRERLTVQQTLEVF